MPQDTPRRIPIAHYYGDTVRGLFVIAAILVFAISPRVGTLASGAGVFLVVGAVVLIICAGLTNPRSRAVLIADALASALFSAIFAGAAMDAYRMSDAYLCIVETLIAAAMLLGLYFSIKSLRAMAMHSIGAEPRRGEFEQR
jgi:hypothetical protein